MNEERCIRRPMAIAVIAVPPRAKPYACPEPFASHMTDRDKRALDHVFGLSNFGIKLTSLAPAASPVCVMRTRGKANSSTSLKAATPTPT